MATITEDEIKRFLQRHLQPGIVLIIGSGLSCAEGLPSMGHIAKHLASLDPSDAGLTLLHDEWATITATITAKGLEAALHELAVREEVADFIRTNTASFILDREAKTIRKVFESKHEMKLTKLFPHLPQDERLHIITTNYDRLIELSAERAGFKVDMQSFGSYHAPFSTQSHPYVFCNKVTLVGKSIRRTEKMVLSLHKPHGSFDWINVDGAPVRTGFNFGADRCLIITPGQSKYRAGYDKPFDMQRENANRAIDNARRYLVIGYGFNDDHLETHLGQRIKGGIPTVVMSYALTDNAKKFLSVHNDIMGLEIGSSSSSTLVHFRGERIELHDKNLWDIEGFVKEVLNG